MVCGAWAHFTIQLGQTGIPPSPPRHPPTKRRLTCPGASLLGFCASGVTLWPDMPFLKPLYLV